MSKLEEGDALYGVNPPAGLPLVFRTRSGAVSHLDCLQDHLRADCGLLTLRVERVEPGARDVRDEQPTLPDADAVPTRMTGADRALIDGERPMSVEDFGVLVHEEEDRNG